MTTVYASSGKDFWGDIVYPLDKGGLTGKMVWAEKMLIRNGYLVEFIYGVLLQDKTDVALCKELYQSYKTNVDITTFRTWAKHIRTDPERLYIIASENGFDVYNFRYLRDDNQSFD